MAWAVVGLAIFLLLLGFFPRTVLTLGALGAGAIVIALIMQSRAHEEWKAEQLTISAKAVYDDKLCSASHPIAVGMRNQGRGTTTEISFNLQAHRSGFSKAVLARYLSSDRILKPGEYYVSCWAIPLDYGQSIPVDVRNLEWSAPISFVYFKR
jgi:hypothetical protein